MIPRPSRNLPETLLRLSEGDINERDLRAPTPTALQESFYMSPQRFSSIMRRMGETQLRRTQREARFVSGLTGGIRLPSRVPRVELLRYYSGVVDRATELYREGQRADEWQQAYREFFGDPSQYPAYAQYFELGRMPSGHDIMRRRNHRRASLFRRTYESARETFEQFGEALQRVSDLINEGVDRIGIDSEYRSAMSQSPRINEEDEVELNSDEAYVHVTDDRGNTRVIRASEVSGHITAGQIMAEMFGSGTSRSSMLSREEAMQLLHDDAIQAGVEAGHKEEHLETAWMKVTDPPETTWDTLPESVRQDLAINDEVLVGFDQARVDATEEEPFMLEDLFKKIDDTLEETGHGEDKEE